MRSSVIALSIALSHFAFGCDSPKDEQTPEEQSAEKAEPASAVHSVQAATPAAAAVSLEAKMGGNVVAVGQHAVELRMHRKGLVEAHVRGANGDAISPDGVELEVTAQAKGGARTPIRLAWSAPHACFRGEAAAESELSTEPLDIKLTIGGKTATAQLAEYALLGEPEFGGQMLVAGGYSAEVLANTDGSVRAAIVDAAGAKLDAKADVAIELPTAAGSAHAVSLAFAPAQAIFGGKAAAGIELAPGPIKLTIAADGKTSAGALAKIVLEANAEHGGQLVTAGDYSLEIVPEADGFLSAYAFDASGKAHASGDLDVELALGAKGEENVKLAWDGAKACYRGKLSAKFDPKLKPLRVSIRAGERLHAGAVASFAAKADLAATAKGSGGLDVKSNVSAKAPSAQAKLAAAKAVNAKAVARVDPPKVNVKKSATASAKTDTKGGAKAAGQAKAGISFGLK